MRTIHPDSARVGTMELAAPLPTITAPANLSSAPDFLTVRELAKVLRIGRNQAYALVNSGQVLSCRFGGSIRIPRTAVQRLLDVASAQAGAAG